MQDKGQDKEQDGEDLAAAAARLGLTVETVRKRLQRGKIKGFKAPDGTWRVVLDKQDKRQDGPGQQAGQEQDKPGQDDGPLIAALRDDIQFLRSQLQARNEEVRRIHVLLQQEQQKHLVSGPQEAETLDPSKFDHNNKNKFILEKIRGILNAIEGIVLVVLGSTIVIMLGFVGSSWGDLSQNLKYDIMEICNRIYFLMIAMSYKYLLDFISDITLLKSLYIRLFAIIVITTMYTFLLSEFRNSYMIEAGKVENEQVMSSDKANTNKSEPTPPANTTPIPGAE